MYSFCCVKNLELGTVARVSYHNTFETDAGTSRVQGQPEPQSETLFKKQQQQLNKTTTKTQTSKQSKNLISSNKEMISKVGQLLSRW